MWLLLNLIQACVAQVPPPIPVISSNFSSSVAITVIGSGLANVTSILGEFYQFNGTGFQGLADVYNETKTVTSVTRWDSETSYGRKYTFWEKPQPQCLVEKGTTTFVSMFEWVQRSKYLKTEVVLGVLCDTFGLTVPSTPSLALTLAYPNNPVEQGWAPKRMVVSSSEQTSIFVFDDFKQGAPDMSRFTLPPYCKTPGEPARFASEGVSRLLGRVRAVPL